MFKLIEISGDTLRLDDLGASRMVTEACIRAGVRAEGAAIFEDKIAVICSEDDSDGIFSYRFTALGAIPDSEIAPVLRCRYDNNFRTVSVFKLADGYWTLTEKNTKGEK